MATLLTFCSFGWPRAVVDDLVVAPGCTQCAAVNTSFGAITLPVQEIAARADDGDDGAADASVEGAPPPTMACAGVASSSARPEIIPARIFIAARSRVELGMFLRIGCVEILMLARLSNMVATGTLSDANTEVRTQRLSVRRPPLSATTSRSV